MTVMTVICVPTVFVSNKSRQTDRRGACPRCGHIYGVKCKAAKLRLASESRRTKFFFGEASLSWHPARKDWMLCRCNGRDCAAFDDCKEGFISLQYSKIHPNSIGRFSVCKLVSMIGNTPKSLHVSARTSIVTRRGAVLSEELAAELYMHKLAKLNGVEIHARGSLASGQGLKGSSMAVAQMYNVSPKTVRDIWNHKTWKYATWHMWSQTEVDQIAISSFAIHKRPGRPKGSRDGKPRQRRSEPINNHNPETSFEVASCPFTVFTSQDQFMSMDHLFIANVSQQTSSNCTVTLLEMQEGKNGPSSDVAAFPPHDGPNQSTAIFGWNDPKSPPSLPSAVCCTSTSIPPKPFSQDAAEPFPTGTENDPFHWDWAFW